MVTFKCECGAAFGIRNKAMEKWEFGQWERIPACPECGGIIPRDLFYATCGILAKAKKNNWEVSIIPDPAEET